MPPKTYIVDIDGTLLKHQGTLSNVITKDGDNYPTLLLDGVLDQLNEWEMERGSKIILITGRKESMRDLTIQQLEFFGIFYNQLIMGVGGGPRVLVNDIKPGGVKSAYSVNVPQDEGLVNFEEIFDKSYNRNKYSLKGLLTMFKTGDFVQLNYYCEVMGTGKGYTSLRDVKSGFEFRALGDTRDLLLSCSKFDNSKIVTKTVMKDLLLGSNGKVFTVKYVKQNGESRTLKGHLMYPDGFGRAHCYDLQDNKGERQVDLRTMFYIIIDGTEYKLK